MADLKERLEEARKEAENLRAQIKKNTEAVADTNLAKFTGDIPALPNVNLKIRRTLKGHLGKIYAMQWSEEGHTLASASQDGKLLIWNAITCLKVNALPLASNWVMTCGYSGTGEYAASGGLDNVCTVWNLRSANPTKPLRELTGHGGFLSCCRFLAEGSKQIVTSSGDHSCAVWDIEAANRVTEFRKHEGDIMFLSLSADKSQFVSGSVDKNCIAWDVKSGKATHTFYGHEKDVNSVAFFPGPNAFASASEDGTVRMWDLRSINELNRYNMEAGPAGPPNPTSLAFSLSGRFLFASYADSPVVVWDTLKAEKKGQVGGHDKRVTSIGISGDGAALCTASWDAFLKIWTHA